LDCHDGLFCLDQGQQKRLAHLRDTGGNTSYLEALTTDTDLYSAQLLLAQAQQEEAASLVEVYTALGGGWR
jgi:multidrug efflux system outer membrane protein